MTHPLKFLLNSQLTNKQAQQAQQTGGFTLIELLVAMIIAALVLTPLLGFMINILDTDRKEQAKAASQQEVQNAMDYIAEDLNKAVFIYDAEGLESIDAQLPAAPNNTIAAPVLVFWKRDIRTNIAPFDGTQTNPDND
ncbi:MAG: prepilin-type N-terminal cleavage/methylation domain-containing protein, partial [Symploca sp. SIO2E6]|nr:prepilin-type N-terminal cleavage/methylation domain-containing protein [Symploca sp. SIO2E6]